jgi:hypothetical protein
MLSEPAVVNCYRLTSANDYPGRDPRDWRFRGSPDGVTFSTLQGSFDGRAWVTLDRRAGETFPERFLPREFTMTNTVPDPRYRLYVTDNDGDAREVQLNRVQLLVRSDIREFIGVLRRADGPAVAYRGKGVDVLTESPAPVGEEAAAVSPSHEMVEPFGGGTGFRFKICNVKIDGRGDAVHVRTGGSYEVSFDLLHDCQECGGAINQVIVARHLLGASTLRPGVSRAVDDCRRTCDFPAGPPRPPGLVEDRPSRRAGPEAGDGLPRSVDAKRDRLSPPTIHADADAEDHEPNDVVLFDPQLLVGRLQPFREEALNRGIPREDVERWINTARPPVRDACHARGRAGRGPVRRPAHAARRRAGPRVPPARHPRLRGPACDARTGQCQGGHGPDGPAPPRSCPTPKTGCCSPNRAAVSAGRRAPPCTG